MKLKHLAISAFLLSFVFLVSHVTTAQEYESPKSAVKLGWVNPGGNGRTVTSGAVTISDKFEGGGLSIGYEYYLSPSPKSEIVLGLQWAGLDEEASVVSGAPAQTESVSVSRWHIPITYKLKFSQGESGGGFYLGAGLSYFLTQAGKETLVSTSTGQEITNNKSAFGFHIKGGFDFNKKMGVDVEWSSAKKDGMDLGGLGFFGVYKF